MFSIELYHTIISSVIFATNGSSIRVRGAEKHEIYAATFGGHLLYDLFLQGRGAWLPRPPGSATV